jgi:drug/metabolite transporter (DMT)-like permease
VNARAGEPARQANLRGIRAMLAAVLVFSVMDTTLKLLAASYPPMQVAALRCLTSLPLVSGWLVWRGALRSALRIRWGLHLLRALLGIVTLALFTYGVKALSLASAYAIFFVGPIVITMLSVWILGERVNGARWLAIGAGMAGVLVALRPTGAGFLTLGGLAVLASAVCYAGSAISARIVARTDRPEHMTFWVMLLMAAGATLLALPGWVEVRAQHAPLLAVLALSGFAGQIAVTEAFRHGDASSVAPFEYTALAWGVAIDWLLWHTLPDRATLLGAAIIIGSGVYLIRHETSHTEAEHP